MTSTPSIQRSLQRTAKVLSNPKNLVVYIDRNILVLNKPPGLICQLHSKKRDTEATGTTLNSIFKKLQKTLPLTCDPYPVHRLDKGTTGSLLLARTASQARELSRQFRQRTVEKTYLALVRGGVKSFPSKNGEIRIPIEYNDGRASLGTSDSGQASITEWELVASSPVAPLSLLRLKLHTGHKHQLRVHMAQYLRSPILGDTLYSSSPPSKLLTSTTEIPGDRIFLHASELSFFQYRTSGPSKRFWLSVRTPLPEDFVKVCMDSKIGMDPLDVKGGLFVDGTFVDDGKIAGM